MPSTSALNPYICARCTRATRYAPVLAPAAVRHRPLTRRYAESATQPREPQHEHGGNTAPDASREKHKSDQVEEGAMTRRLRHLSEESLEGSGRGGAKAVEEAGFSEDLKKQLEDRIAAASFRAEHRNAFAEIEISSSAGRGTRDIAAADPWTGQESIHDASLRMLNDAHKPLRLGRGARIPGPAAPPPKRVDTGRRSNAGSGVRLANARDRSGLYSSLKGSSIDEQEREKRFQELKARFSPDARSVVPGTIQGLASMANERIENAIARGQFKNLPRGKKLERDYNASNPFLDTTEYFMNKIIQKQEIVPPWIEKQQELVAAATKFRSRLRNDWRRHAARMIASKGGSLQDQMRRADAYAKAELIVNPPKKKEEVLNAVEDSGRVSQISLSGELKVPKSGEAPIEEEFDAEKTIISDAPVADEELSSPTSIPAGSASTLPAESSSSPTISVPLPTSSPPPTTVPPAPYPFRDPNWESIESAYHNLSINDLNSKTRSYNLQAPDLAKKPYFSLSRELNACYADVAPQLAEAIRERAAKPRKTQGFGPTNSGSAGVMDRLMGDKVKVRDERVGKQYGFRQFWKDVWGAQ